MDYNTFNTKFPLPDSMNLEFTKFSVDSLVEEKGEKDDKDEKSEKDDEPKITGKSKKTKVEINPSLEDIQEV